MKFRLEQLREEGIEFFSDVISLLKTYGIVHWIEYGSLLGFQRHNGLIPWDSEFDIGVFDEDWDESIEADFIAHNYIVVKEPNRVKLKPKIKEIGIFTIDIHIHQKVEGSARLLFGQLNPSKSKLADKLYWFFDMTKHTEKPKIRYLSIMKLLSQRFDITEEELLRKEITLKRGIFSHEKSFELEIQGENLNDFFLSEIRVYRAVLLKLTRLIPNKIHARIIVHLFKRLIKPTFYPKYQTMPLEIYEDLEEVIFCGVAVNAPVNRIFFLKRVYGIDWEIPKMNFSRFQMKNLKVYRR